MHFEFFARFWSITEPIQKLSVKKTIFKRLLPIIQTLNPREFNQAVMELGALVCRPHKPDCCACPINDNCIANIKNLTEKIPQRLQRRSTPQYLYGAGGYLEK